MLTKSKIKTFLLLFFIIAASVVLPAYSTDNPPNLAANLGWISQKNNYNLCNGYYLELPIDYTINPLVQSQANNYDIKADETIYALKGISTLKGNVHISRPDCELTSDIAYLYRDKKTFKPTIVKVSGNVYFLEPGSLALAQQGEINLQTNEITLQKSAYRKTLSSEKPKKVKNPKTGKKEKRLYQMTAWGQAKKVIRNDKTTFYQATYTTCSPTQNAWKLKASKLQLNPKTGRGRAYNARLLIKGIPIFYTPYFNFPIDKKRHTGFLNPSFGSSNNSGFTMNFPFYWNIAPNYDATISPSIMSSRGMLLNNLFRYLTPESRGELSLGVIANDHEFKNFKEQAKAKWKNRPSLYRLENANDNRWKFTWKDETRFNPNWNTEINFNKVSDDYYMHDFGDSLIDNSENQLSRNFRLNYANKHWSFLGNLQSYQTLHPVDQADVMNQYARLPQLLFNGYFPYSLYGLTYSIQTEAVHFTKDRNPGEKTEPTTGNRLALRPSVSLPIIRPFGYLTPRIQMQATKYKLSHPFAQNYRDPGIAIPIFDLKAGLYFDRRLKIFGTNYLQTLEPKFYYLYAPYFKQKNMPIFDTAEQSFNYNMMFQDNRFSGIDRVGDANQTTLGLETRFINKNTGDEKAKVGLGQIYYFNKRKVTLCTGNDCHISDADNTYKSPIAAFASYHFNPSWSAGLELTWNPQFDKFDHQTISIQYLLDSDHIINAGYTFLRGGDILSGAPKDSPKNNLKQTDISTSWRLTNRWNLLGRWNYNWSHGHKQAYFIGFEYETCCWAIRLISAKTFTGVAPGAEGRSQFDTSFYIQFSLKGLGNIGSKNPSGILSQGILGYIDKFGQDN